MHNNNGYTVVGKPSQSGLAVTPQQMLDLSQQGVPINASQSSDNFDDGSTLCDNPTLDQMRGVDANQLWDAEYKIKNKAKDL